MDEHSIQELIDRQEITGVLIEYCCALDRMDLTRLAALFTDDCDVDYGPDPRLQSQSAEPLQTGPRNPPRSRRTSTSTTSQRNLTSPSTRSAW